MPTSERRTSGLAAAATLLLAASGLASAASAAPATRTKVNVAGQAVTIAAPAGFCVDTKSTTTTTDGAFVLMSDCSLLGGRKTGSPVAAALTASVSAGGLAGEGDTAADSLEDLQDFAATADGRAVLGRSGQADRVRILSTVKGDGVLYLLIEDRGRMPLAGIDRTFWRAFLDVNGRTVALSELGFTGGGVDPQQGLNHLGALAAAIRAAN